MFSNLFFILRNIICRGELPPKVCHTLSSKLPYLHSSFIMHQIAGLFHLIHKSIFVKQWCWNVTQLECKWMFQDFWILFSNDYKSLKEQQRIHWNCFIVYGNWLFGGYCFNHVFFLKRKVKNRQSLHNAHQTFIEIICIVYFNGPIACLTGTYIH